jgi:catechol 2,3-dioxygenase-like lactoylglutathione lyase family enzyme
MKITAYDHVGLRVTDRARSVAFYESLGFRLDEEHSSANALEIVNESGVRMNLILNGEPTALRDKRPHGPPGKVAGVHACRLHR